MVKFLGILIVFWLLYREKYGYIPIELQLFSGFLQREVWLYTD